MKKIFVILLVLLLVLFSGCASKGSQGSGGCTSDYVKAPNQWSGSVFAETEEGLDAACAAECKELLGVKSSKAIGVSSASDWAPGEYSTTCYCDLEEC